MSYFDKYFLCDPYFNIEPPPVQRLYAIYGVNLETECLYFIKKNKKKDGLILDTDPKIELPGYTFKSVRKEKSKIFLEGLL